MAATVAAVATDEVVVADDEDGVVVALSPSSLAPRPLSVTEPFESTLPSSSSAVASATPLTTGHFKHTNTHTHDVDMTEYHFDQNYRKEMKSSIHSSHARTALYGCFRG